MLKKIIPLILSLVLLLAVTSITVVAQDEVSELSLTFDLTSDGLHKVIAKPGDKIKVDFNIIRTDSDSKYLFNIFQNDIIFDDDFFEYVEGSAKLCNGIYGDIAFRKRTTGVPLIQVSCLSLNSLNNLYTSNVAFCNFELRLKENATGTGIIQSDECQFYDSSLLEVVPTTTVLEVIVEGEANVPVSGVSLLPDKILFTDIGETKRIDVTVTPENATNKGLTYESSDEKVATVSADGTVRATGKGEAKITVTTLDGGFTAYCNVKVSLPSGGANVTPQIKPNEGKEDEKPGRPATIPEVLTDKHIAYIVGREEGKVQPQANITRAEVATIFFRLLKDDVRQANYTEENTFADVNAGDWYNTAISTLAKMKIINGRSETEFAPNAFITRAEYATIAARLAQVTGEEKVNFSDINGHWANEYILKAASLGWIIGNNGKFRPDDNITRAEAMTLTNRVLCRQPESISDILSENMTRFTDNADVNAWYYLAIQEATNSHEYRMKSDGKHETWIKLTETPDFSKLER